jgi:hypothetical protein
MKSLSVFFLSLFFVFPVFIGKDASAVNVEDGAFLADKGGFAYRLYLSSSTKNTVKEKYGSYSDIYKGTLDLYYGVTDDITLTFQGIYSHNGTEDRKGIQKANVEGFIRAVDDVFFFDLLFGMSLGGILDSEMDAEFKGDLSASYERTIYPRNYSYGMYGLIGGGRFGMKVSPRLSVAILFEATHRFSQDDTLKAEIDATEANHPLLGYGTKFKAKGTLEPLTDYYTQIAVSYEPTENLYINTKVGYQYYAEKHLKEASPDSATNQTDNAIIAGLIGQGFNDSWYEFSFGISAIYAINNLFQIGPYYEYMSGENSEKALQLKQRMEYGLKINGAF